MQKIIGFLMIFIGCMGMGGWYSLRFRGEIEVLREFCCMLEMFLSEIRYSRCTLPEGCMRVAERVREPYSSLFMAIYERSYENTGESFGEVCREILEAGLSEENVCKEDKELFLGCFVNGSFAEDVMQLRVMEQAKEALEERKTFLEKGLASRCRLSLGLGTMSGLLIIVLLW